MSPRTVSLLIRFAFALLGGTFLAVAAIALFAEDISNWPIWLTGPIGLFVALILFGTSALAPRRANAIAWDEVTKHNWLRAQAFGYWTGVFAFAIFGNMVSAGLMEVNTAFVTGAMLAASAPFVRFLLAEWLSGE